MEIEENNLYHGTEALTNSWINHQKQSHHYILSLLSNHTPVLPSILSQHSP